jgi:hypothetical protein
MKAKQLEAILGSELGIGEAEMVQRFQKLRDSQMLPVSRGRNAEHLTSRAIVSGLLSVVAQRPGFAGVTTKILSGLRPVGGSAKGFAQAETFAAALEAALLDEALLNSVAEIRMTDSEVYKNSNGRGAIFFGSGENEQVTYYVRGEAMTLLRPGAEETYDPRDMIKSAIREIVVFPEILKRIARQMREEEKHAQLMDRFEKQTASGN